MKQMSMGGSGFERKTKLTRKREFRKRSSNYVFPQSA